MENMHIRHLVSEDGRVLWILLTEHTAYAFGLDEHGYLQHRYWGKRLSRDSDYGWPAAYGTWAFERTEGISQEEFPAWGDVNYSEPCIKATFADNADNVDCECRRAVRNVGVRNVGVRNVVLRYDSFSITTSSSITTEKENERERATLTVSLRDTHYPLAVHLIYRVIPECDLIERSAIIENKGDAAIDLEQILSAAWHFPQHDSYRLTTLVGKWGAETQVQEMPIGLGKQVLESRRGNTSHQANPWFAIDANGSADEIQGEVWHGALAFSGNWKFVVERNDYGQVMLTGGINDFDFTWRLEAGESLTLPTFIAGYSESGFGHASRQMHRYQLSDVLPATFAHRLRPVLYNSWYVTLFDVETEHQMETARIAADLGAELFVVDDGWFAGRKDDTAGLGDWFVDRDKFPNGLSGLVDQVNELGMDFGLWVEPEMVNPDSDLYRAHPDWVYHFPDRSRTTVRNQLVLNFARQDVRDTIFDALDAILEAHNITFIKWDMNRHFSEPGWPDAAPGHEREFWVRHALGVYEIVERLRARHPNVLFESCSGGGGRVDLGILRWMDQVWTSDNTDPADYLLMAEGNSMAYAPKTRMMWVTDSDFMNNRLPNLQFRFHAAMTGALGIGANLLDWTHEDRAEARKLIAEYKEIRNIVQHGLLYRLRSPRLSGLTAVQYVAQNLEKAGEKNREESVVFIFLHSSNFGPVNTVVRLQGLDAEAIYQVDDNAEMLSGAALMHRGMPIDIRGDYVSRLMHIRRVQ